MSLEKTLGDMVAASSVGFKLSLQYRYAKNQNSMGTYAVLDEITCYSDIKSNSKIYLNDERVSVLLHLNEAKK